MIVELSFIFIVILGRWLLPKGNISHSALSQLLLVYLSLASDMLDLLTLFNEVQIYLSSPMVHIVLIIFSLSLFQFALNLTATRGRAFHAEFDDTEVELTTGPPPVSPHLQTFSSSTTRPLSNKSSPRVKPRASSFYLINPPDTIFENVDSTREYEMQTTLPRPMFTEYDPPARTLRHPMITHPSIGSINSLQSSLWNALPSKQVSRRSVAESVKKFVVKRTSKFLRSEIWSILATLSLQDGPFLAIRLVAILVYRVRSFLPYFFTFKNLLILLFQTYRIVSICLEKDEKEKELEENLEKIRRISTAASQLVVPLHRNI